MADFVAEKSYYRTSAGDQCYAAKSAARYQITAQRDVRASQFSALVRETLAHPTRT